MKKEFTDINTFEKIVYEESAWTGKKTITVNGTPCTKENKTTYVYSNGEKTSRITVTGNFLNGVSLKYGENSYQIYPKTAWYEYLFMVLMLLIPFVWGNVPALVKIVPIIGGAIGGLIGGVMIVLYVFVSRKVEKAIFKVLVGIGFFAATFLLCYLAALLFISALT